MSRTAAAVSISFAALFVVAGCSSMGSAQLRQGWSLAPCDGVNCMSSQSTDPDRHIAPIVYSGSRSGAQQLMASIIARSEGAKIVAQEDGYIHATYSSSMLGFVDDLELQFPAQKVIEVRSASRAGLFDFGANRKRIEGLRKAFGDLQP